MSASENGMVRLQQWRQTLLWRDSGRQRVGSRQTQKAIRHLTAVCIAAIRMHAPTRNIHQLRHNLRNCPYHVFGDYSSCNPAFCKVRSGTDGASSDTDDTTEDSTGTPVNSSPITDTTTLQQQISDIIQQEKEDDMSPLTLPLQEEREARSWYTASLDQLPDDLFFSVLRADDWLVSLAEQLVDNQTSNLAERYMGLRSFTVERCTTVFNQALLKADAMHPVWGSRKVPNGLLTLAKRLLASNLHSHQ